MPLAATWGGRDFRTHRSGPNFLEAAKREMPQALVLCTTGSRFSFGA
jgi:7,8-dihydropterin-6-yl-methyl-4-(beta-D-ribofuranosyl)aminobenzene 5'-phosphate synthase